MRPNTTPKSPLPAGAAMPEANYKMIAALSVMKGQIERADIPKFVAERGMPGFVPTQGTSPWRSLYRPRAGSPQGGDHQTSHDHRQGQPLPRPPDQSCRRRPLLWKAPVLVLNPRRA